MKLLFCNACKDILLLKTRVPQVCECQSSSGYYEDDGLVVKVWGPCDVLGIANMSFSDALFAHQAHPEGADRRLMTGAREGWKFDAFFIPRIGEEHHVRRH